MFKQTIFLLASAASMVVAHHVRGLPHRAVASLKGNNVQGNITFTELEDGRVQVQGTIIGMAAGSYGFHVHEKGDLTGGCLSTGAHFNPNNQQHGHPQDEARHVGDMGNAIFDDTGVCHVDFIDKEITLHGTNNVIGRAVVLHAGQDDYGKTNHPDSRTTGNAGGRVACGVIGIVDPVYNYTNTWSNSGAGASSITSFLLLASPILFFVKLFV